MHINIFTTIAACLTLAQAFTLPEGAKDGAYALRTTDAGEEYAAYLGPLDAREVSKRASRRSPVGAQLSARDQSGCTGQALNHANCDAATAALKNYCGGGTHYYDAKMAFVSGSVIAYTCDYSGGQECFSSEAATAYTEVSEKCGSYVSGWWLFGDNKNYGYDKVGASFCSNV